MIKKALLTIAVAALSFSCSDWEMTPNFYGDTVETRKCDKDNGNNSNKAKNGNNGKDKIYTTILEVVAEEGAATRLYDGELQWHWEYGDALLGYQVAVNNLRNRLEYNLQTTLFACSDFTYQSTKEEKFHFVYPYGAEYENGQLKAIQDGNWRPVCYCTTEPTTVDALPYLNFTQLSSALELRVWNQNNYNMQESVVSAVLTSDSDFVGKWTLDETTMTYFQTLEGKQIAINDINKPVVQVNMPDLPAGYTDDVKIKVVLTRADGKTCTFYLPKDLTFVKQKRTVYHVVFTPDPTFTCATYNVDGLPAKVLGFIPLNDDGPGSNGTKVISQNIAASGWDIVTFQENFSYNTELESAMKSVYTFGTHRKFSLLSALGTADTDGLGFATRNTTCTFVSVAWWAFNAKEGGLTDGANTSIKKGVRHYVVKMNNDPDVLIDVLVTHMNTADNDAQIAAQNNQLSEVADYINSIRSNNRPIIFMGDMNTRYTRNDHQTYFWSKLDSDLICKDPWVEHMWDGEYPTYPSDAILTSDYGMQYGEVVDKIIYINNPNAKVQLKSRWYNHNESYTGVADHNPVVVEFGYEKK